jgi:hypothetical protein
MLALNRSLLNRDYILMHVLKTLASIISMCNFHVIFLSKINLDILNYLQMGYSAHST